MKKSSSELKSLAKGTLLGRYSSPILACLILFLISFGLNFVLSNLFPYYTLGGLLSYFLCMLIIEILLTLLSVGLQFLLLNMARGYEGSVSDLFFAFKNQPDKIILYFLAVTGLGVLSMLPSFAAITLAVLYPGLLFLRVVCVLIFLANTAFTIVLLLSYVLVPYLYLDHPDYGTLELLKLSKELMKGQRGRYFYLSVSFIGVALLSSLTLFIGLLWVVPYMNMTFVQFYRNVIHEL